LNRPISKRSYRNSDSEILLLTVTKRLTSLHCVPEGELCPASQQRSDAHPEVFSEPVTKLIISHPILEIVMIVMSDPEDPQKKIVPEKDPVPQSEIRKLGL